MGRILPPGADGGQAADEDIRALMEDIDASMADLERRLEESRRPGGRRTPADAGSPTPQPAAPAAPRTPLPEAAPAQAPAPAGRTQIRSAEAAEEASGFLAELAQEAEGRLGDGRLGEAERRARNRQIHETLERLFHFLNQFARHANNIGPQIGRAYRLDTRTAYEALRWQGAFADYRKQDLSEKALLAHVGFRVRLVAPAPVVVYCRWDQLDNFKREMHILDLRTVEGHEPVGGLQQEHIEIRLAPDFPMQIRFRGNYEAGRLDVLARNIEGFGIAAFELDPREASQAVFDGIGRFLMFRSDQLPAALRRVQISRESQE